MRFKCPIGRRGWLILALLASSGQTLFAQTMAGGRSHSLFVDTNGHLWAWGANNAGQLGDVTKDRTQRLQPLRVGVETNWEKVFADGDSSFAIKKDGSLWAWGQGQLGQLGDGTRTSRGSPVRIGGKTLWQEVSIRDGAVLAIQRDGSLWAWGKNTNGTLGLGRGRAMIQSQPTRVGTRLWKSVAVGNYHYTDTIPDPDREVWTRSFGVDLDGRMWTWGQDSSENSPPLYVAKSVDENTDWIKVVSPTHTTDGNLDDPRFSTPLAAALQSEGQISQWNSSSQTFRPLDTNTFRPPVPGDSWADLVCGKDHLLARGKDGTLWSWGYNGKFQLGRRGVEPDFRAINWARLSGKTLGEGNGSAEGTIALPDLTGFSITYGGDVASGSQAGQTNPSRWSGLPTGGYTAPDNTDILLFRSQVGVTNRIDFQDATTNRPGVYRPVLAISGLGSQEKNKNGEVIKTNTVVLRFSQPCLVISPFQVNFRNEFSSDKQVIGGGEGGLVQIQNDEPISFLEWEVISSQEDATNTTGFNVGIMQTINLVWRADLPTQMGEADDWGAVAGGGLHSLGIKGGQLVAWGDNSGGQCGNLKDSFERLQPDLFLSNGVGWAQILPGKDFTFFRDRGGRLSVMGNAEATNLSTGSAFYPELTNITGSSAWTEAGVLESTSSNSIGKRIFVLQTNTGALVGWGGRDGLSPTDGLFALPWWDPQQDTFGTMAGPWDSLSSNVGKGEDSHVVAVRSDGTLWAWGANTNGQLGDGTQMMKDAPIQVGRDTRWKRAFAGGAHSLALQADGSLWVWGANSNGALGLSTNVVSVSNTYAGGTNSTNSTSADPKVYGGRVKTTTVALASNVFQPALVLAKGWGVREVSAGASHNLILRRDGSLWAMGANDQGQLGTGTVTGTNLNSGGTNTNSADTGSPSSTNGFRTFTVTNLVTNINYVPWRVENNVDTFVDQSWMYRTQRVGLKTWTKISAGDNHSLGIRTDGTLWGWGGNESGQVGDGTRLRRTVPVQIGAANNWNQVWAGRAESFAMKNDGTLYRWGFNTNQAGLGKDIVTNPTQVDFGKLGLGTLVLRQGGQLAGLGILSFQPGDRYVDVILQVGDEPGSRIQFAGGTNFGGGANVVRLPDLQGVRYGQTNFLSFSPLQRLEPSPQSIYVGTARWARQQYQAELLLGTDRDRDGLPDETDAFPEGPLPELNSPVRVEGRVAESFHYEITTRIPGRSNNPVTFFCESDLPDGLQLDKRRGILAGTPTKVGRIQLVVGANNNSGSSVQVIQVTILPQAPAITSPGAIAWTNGSEPFFFQVTASETNHPGYPVRFSSKGLPPGLGLHPRNGTIRPANPGNRRVPAPGLYRASLFAANPRDQGSNDLFITSVGTNWRVGKPLRFQVSLRGVGLLEFSNLPDGLKGNARSGTVTGVPLEAGTHQVAVSQSKVSMGRWKTNFTLTIAPAETSLAAAKEAEGASGSSGISGSGYPAIFSMGPLATQAVEATGRVRRLSSPARNYALLWTNVEDWQWEGSFPGLATRLKDEEIILRRSERVASRPAVRLARIAYATGRPGTILPTNHAFWLKQSDGTMSCVDGNPKEARLDFSQPGLVGLLAERVKFLRQNGCVDGVYLPSWDETALWPADSLPQKAEAGESQGPVRLELLRQLRAAVGPQGWIVAEATGGSWALTGPMLDGVHLAAATEAPPAWPPAEGWWPDPYMVQEQDSPLTLWERLLQSLKIFGQPGVLRQPGRVMLELWARHDLKEERTKEPRLAGLAMSLCLSDGAYLYARPDWWQEQGKSVAPGEHLWFPEWGVRLGRPREFRQNQAGAKGYYRREFENGWAAYAPLKLRSAVEVEFPEVVESVASGKRERVHELLPGHGDLFLRKN